MSGGGEAMLYPYRPAGEHRLPGLRPGGAAGPGALLGLMRDVGQLFDCEPVVLQRPDSPALLLFYPDTVFPWRDLAEVCGGALAGLYKGAFFVLRAAHDARAGYRAVSRRHLLPRLEGDDREILAACIGRKAFLDADRAALDEGYRALIRWCGKILRECGGAVASV